MKSKDKFFNLMNKMVVEFNNDTPMGQQVSIFDVAELIEKHGNEKVEPVLMVMTSLMCSFLSDDEHIYIEQHADNNLISVGTNNPNDEHHLSIPNTKEQLFYYFMRFLSSAYKAKMPKAKVDFESDDILPQFA